MNVRVPLRWQPPNPPSPLVGRDDDVARLLALLTRSPVAVVWGFSGVGKSALVQATLHAHGEAGVARTLWLRGDDDVLAALATRLRELGARAGGDVEDIAETLEALGLWVVVDGVERLGDHAGLPALAQLLVRHARRARLVCVCREDPRDPALLTCTLRVAPPDDDALARLADALVPGLTAGARRALLEQARGSPWRLVQLTLDGDGGVSAPEASLLALSPIARGLLATLALGAGGLPLAVLQRATRLPDDDALRSLARRGWIERVGDVLHLHHAAIPLVIAGISAEERRRRRARLVEALLGDERDDGGGADDDRGAQRRRALRLARAILDDEGAIVAAPFARRLLVGAGRVLRARGDAASLWTLVVGAGLLAEVDDATLIGPLAGLAVDVGDDAVALIAPAAARRRDVSAADRVDLAALCSARGAHEAARALLRTVIDDDSADAGDADGAADTAVLAGALALVLERGDDDLVAPLLAKAPAAIRPALAALTPRSPREATTSTKATSPLALWPTLPAPVQAPLVPALARALLAGARVDDALSVIGDNADEGDGDITTARGRELAVVRRRARALAGDLTSDTPFADNVPGAGDARHALEAALWHFIARARRGLFDEAERARLRAAVDEVSSAPRLSRLAAVVREGPAEERERRRSADPFLDNALAALAATSTSLTAARALRAAARSGGDRLAALELAFAVGDAMVAADDRAPDDVIASVVDLARVIASEARALGSPRGVDEASLFLALAEARSGVGGATRTGLASLAGLAQGGHGALVRRRARLLLGDAVDDDAFDLGQWRPPSGPSPVRSAVVAGAGDAPDRAWTVDEARRRIVVGHDVVVDLADKGILFALLVALGRRGGAATKEQLQQDVWGERHYHPLRHDNRLKVAVRKLRRLLEDALGDDPLEASDDGYRLRGRVRFVSAPADRDGPAGAR